MYMLALAKALNHTFSLSSTLTPYSSSNQKTDSSPKATAAPNKDSDDKGQTKPSSMSGVEETNYNPSMTNYHPVDNACWKRGQKLVKEGGGGYSRFSLVTVWFSSDNWV